MLAEEVKRTNIGVGIGIVAQILGRVLMGVGASSKSFAMVCLGIIVLLAGVVFFIWGCFAYARGKGYSPVLGILGLFSLLGLIVLVVLPDKHKSPGKAGE